MLKNILPLCQLLTELEILADASSGSLQEHSRPPAGGPFPPILKKRGKKSAPRVRKDDPPPILFLSRRRVPGTRQHDTTSLTARATARSAGFPSVTLSPQGKSAAGAGAGEQSGRERVARAQRVLATECGVLQKCRTNHTVHRVMPAM